MIFDAFTASLQDNTEKKESDHNRANIFSSSKINFFFNILQLKVHHCFFNAAKTDKTFAKNKIKTSIGNQQ